MLTSLSFCKYPRLFVSCVTLLLALMASSALGAIENYNVKPVGPLSSRADGGGAGPNPGTYGSFDYTYRNGARAAVSDIFWYADSGAGLASDYDFIGTGRELDITKNGGGTFSFKGLTLCGYTNKNGGGSNTTQAAIVYFQGYNGASKNYDSGAVNIPECGWGTTPWTTYAPGTVWSNITELRIVSTTDVTFDPMWDNFEYFLLPAPAVTSISPTSGSTVGSTSVTISGTGFVNGATVTIGGTAATGVTWNSATSITATIPSGTAGAKDVVVTNPDTQTGTLAGGYTYTTNSAPTDIALSASAINENVVANSTVGTLSTTDPDVGNTFTYTLVTGTGAADNASFNISGSSLRITNSPEFETKNSYSVRIRSTDQGSLWVEKAFTITVNDLNEAPTDIALSASSINENVVANSTVGILSSTDSDAGNTFTYTLVAGLGSADNASFNISGSSLRITSSPNYEVKNSYSVRIRSTDQGGLYFEKAFTITINDLNEAPTNIALSASSINENVAANSTVGTLSSTDPDVGNSFTYTLVAGPGSTDNASFNISGSSLRINSSPNYEVKNSYSVLIRSTDQGGLYFEKTFTITINDVNEAPTFVGVTTTLTVNQDSSNNDIRSLLHVSDPDASQTETWTQSVAPNHGTLIFTGATASTGSGSTDLITSGTITYTPTAGYSGPDSFTVQVSDGTLTATRTITVTVMATPVATAASAITFTGFTANWNAVSVATNYYLDVATDSGFTGFVGIYNNLDVGNVTTQAIAGLTSGTPYFYRVRGYSNGVTSASSNTIALATVTTRTVTSASDSGAGTLRQTILASNPGDAIIFDNSLNGQTITIASPLAISNNLSITGPGAANLTISGGGTSQLFQVTGTTSFTLKNLTLANGAAIVGGAILDDPAGTTTTTISGCIFTGNSAPTGGNGGAIYTNGTMTISDSTFSGNSTAAISGYGGAIFANNGTLLISTSTFSNNSAAAGGAIANSSAAMTLTNVTMTGNSSSTYGGGIFAAGGAINILNATISGNSVTNPAGQGGGIAVSGSAVNMKNSIVSDNIAAGGGPDIFGAFTSLGYNLVRDASGATYTATTGDLTGSDPKLGALANNGGLTKTMALLFGSAAIDAGTCTGAPAADQRGMSRGSACDMGAYERGVPSALTASGGTPQGATVGTIFSTPLAATLTDSLGGPLDGVSVVFAGTGSGADISSGSSVSTSLTGIANFTPTANNSAGAYTATATVGALVANFSLTNNPGPATHFTVTAPATTAAGAAFSLTVTARDTYNNIASGYTGTIHFTKTDASVSSLLPADYTFLAGDNGVHTFTSSATLITAAGQTITATDTVTSSITGGASVTVNPAAATHFTVTAPATTTAGSAFSMTVTARDAYNNIASGYTGTVHFTKTDAGAGSLLPADYSFIAGDNGAHPFTNGATLITAAGQTVTATDTVSSGITGGASVIVNSAAATHFTVTAPATTTAGSAFSMT
ncbi:MAG: IPT/TIG domain-containing protein, partial [Geobacteraceae bacterium]|nr:IPT/TIG domain-containing protein [Geobacteraceae bacterium]